MTCKVCTTCGKKFPATAAYFHRDKHLKEGLRAQCIECKRKYNNSNKGKSNKLNYLYSLTLEEYDRMLEAQDGVCAICGRPETHVTGFGGVDRLSVDHDHETEGIRGLLCRKCNLIIGNADDNVGILVGAIKYLTDNDV